MENQEAATNVAQAEAAALAEVQALCEALEEAHTENLKDKIKSWPQRHNNASSIGHPCERYLYYLRAESDSRAPHGPSLQGIFDLGNFLEPHITDIISRAARRIGYHWMGQQKSFHDERVNLSGRIDGGLVKLDGRGVAGGHPIPTEVKTCSPFTFEKIKSVADLRAADEHYLRSYYDQLQSYLYMFGEPLGVIVLFNKSTAKPRFIPVELDFVYYETVLKKCERVNIAVETKTVPERNIDFDICTECAFKRICFEGAELTLPVVDNDVLLDAIQRKESFAEAHRQYEAAAKIVKDQCNRSGLEQFNVGEYIVSRKFVEKGPQEATTYWTNTVKHRSKLK